MVKHIVLFKLKDEVPAEEKLEVMTKFKEAIEALPAKISVIRKVEVGLNMNPGETWNIALYSEFDTLEDVKFYARTTLLRFSQNLSGSYVIGMCCVEFNIF